MIKRLYVPNPDDWTKFCDQKYFSDRTVEVKTLERGIILPTRHKDGGSALKFYGGVCDRNQKFVAGYSDVQSDPWRGSYVVDGAYEIERSEIAQSDDDVIFGGLMIYHFGHFMTETLSRMWYVEKNPDDQRKIAFVVVSVTRLQVMRPWVLEFLSLLGITEDRLLLVETPTQFRSITIPDQALYLRENYSRECMTVYRSIAARAASIVPSDQSSAQSDQSVQSSDQSDPIDQSDQSSDRSDQSARKIFLSRSPDVESMMHLFNQNYFEEFYRRRGFSIVYPEKLSVARQIALISNADEVVTFLGSLSHWALFCRPQTKFVMLTRVDNDRAVPTRMRQALIDQAAEIDWYVVSIARSFLYAEQGGGTCLLGSTEHWRDFVRDHFGETIDDAPIPSEIIGNYIRHWCRFFGDGHEHHWVNSIKNLYRRLDSSQAILDEISARIFSERSSSMDDNQLKRRLYVPNFEHWKALCTKKYFSDRQLEVQTVERGIILPALPIDAKDPYHCRGGVCDQNQKFVAGYNNLPPGQKNGAYCIDEAYEIAPDALERSDEDVIFGGILVCHLGHFLTDCMARMWYVVQNPDDLRKVVFLMLKTSQLQSLKNWVYQLFDLIGLSEDRIIILEKPTQFQSVTIPDQSVRIKHDFTREFLMPFEHIKRRLRPSNIKKIFLTRSPNVVSSMHLCNQKYFEDFYRARGFKIISPESYSIVDQVSLIMGADEVVTFLGTLAHWSLLSHKGARWTMINRVDGISTRQCLINEAVGIDWCFVSAAMNFLYAEQGGGTCLLGPTEQWQRYALEHYKIQLDPNARLPLPIVDEYIERWCKFFSGNQNMKRRISSLENLYSRITILEKQVELKRPVLCFDLHSAQRGWLPTNVEGDIGGFEEKEWSLQAIKIKFNDPFCDVRYAVFYPDSGWTSEFFSGQQAGITGKDKAFYGISIRLDNSPVGNCFNILYRVHSFKGNWSMWRRNGERIATREYKLNALQIKIEPRVRKE